MCAIVTPPEVSGSLSSTDEGRREAWMRSRLSESTHLAVIDTTEVRWFLPGPLPPAVRHWFSGGSGFSEERRDLYLLDGRDDFGVKFRNGETLEVKARLDTEGSGKPCGGLAGELEVWRKWVPARGPEEPSSSQRWVEVDKAIFKRRFSLDGAELEFTTGQVEASGCDVEIVAIRVDAIRAWSYAFAAYGPPPNRCVAIGAAWRAVRSSDASIPNELRLGRSRCMGYPEWLGRMTLPENRSGEVHRPPASTS